MGPRLIRESLDPLGGTSLASIELGSPLTEFDGQEDKHHRPERVLGGCEVVVGEGVVPGLPGSDEGWDRVGVELGSTGELGVLSSDAELRGDCWPRRVAHDLEICRQGPWPGEGTRVGDGWPKLAQRATRVLEVESAVGTKIEGLTEVGDSDRDDRLRVLIAPAGAARSTGSVVESKQGGLRR